MPGTIYLLDDDNKLRALEEQPYDNEDLLQKLLGDHPDLLAGDQMDEGDPRRWLLVDREVSVPFKEGAVGGMSLDHLFLDQDGVPTLVEVKQASDSRIRREVVGQMLDYASHAVAYWSGDTIRARYEARCETAGSDPDQILAEFLSLQEGEDAGIEPFWVQVKTNLQAGRIRLLFVADHIPAELRRVVEFLNRFTDPVEVLAVEVPQYVGDGMKTLVPRVIGQTAEAQAKKSGGRSTRWDEPSFFAKLEEESGAVEVDVARKILEWATTSQLQIWWGMGSRTGAFVPFFGHEGKSYSLFPVYTYGKLEVYFQHYLNWPPFDSEEKRRELLDRLNAIEGVSIPQDAIAKRPSLPLTLLTDDAKLQQFLRVFD